MSIDELRAFLAVAEHMSFIGAANALGVARTSLRRQVDALEARTGVPLLERGRAGVVLTEAGRVLLERGRGLDREFSALLSSAREAGATPAGLVRALLPVGLPHKVLGAILAMARSVWPQIRVHIRFADAPLTQPLADFDLVVWFGLDTPAGAWRCHTFQHTPLRLLGSAAYLAARGTPTSLDDLDRHDLFLYAIHAGDQAITTRRGERHPVQAVMSTPNVDLLHDLVHRDVGLAWVPDGAIPDPSGHAAPVVLLDDVIGAPLELRIAAPTAIAAAPRLHAFLGNLEAIRTVANEPMDDA